LELNPPPNVLVTRIGEQLLVDQLDVVGVCETDSICFGDFWLQVQLLWWESQMSPRIEFSAVGALQEIVEYQFLDFVIFCFKVNPFERDSV